MDKTTAQFSHVNIVTQDMEAMCGFFHTHFGMEVSKPTSASKEWVSAITGFEDASVTFTVLTSKDQSTRIEVLYFENPPSPANATDEAVPNVPGYRHIGFEVPNIWDRYEHMTKEGFNFLSKPQHVPELGVTTVYFQGPEGILVQLTQKKDKNAPG